MRPTPKFVHRQHSKKKERGKEAKRKEEKEQREQRSCSFQSPAAKMSQTNNQAQGSVCKGRSLPFTNSVPSFAFVYLFVCRFYLYNLFFFANFSFQFNFLFDFKKASFPFPPEFAQSREGPSFAASRQ
jgi:hypothetical protein